MIAASIIVLPRVSRNRLKRRRDERLRVMSLRSVQPLCQERIDYTLRLRATNFVPRRAVRANPSAHRSGANCAR